VNIKNEKVKVISCRNIEHIPVGYHLLKVVEVIIIIDENITKLKESTLWIKVHMNILTDSSFRWVRGQC